MIKAAAIWKFLPASEGGEREGVWDVSNICLVSLSRNCDLLNPLSQPHKGIRQTLGGSWKRVSAWIDGMQGNLVGEWEIFSVPLHSPFKTSTSCFVHKGNLIQPCIKNMAAPLGYYNLPACIAQRSLSCSVSNILQSQTLECFGTCGAMVGSN